jgi:predicted dehydrogenase
MAATAAEARAVAEVCRKAGVRLMVNFVHRFRAEYRQAQAALQAGAIGRPLVVVETMVAARSELPGWVWDRAASGGGMMMYNGVHSLDRMAWLAGSPISRVTAASGTFGHAVELEDTLVGTVAFASGALGAVVQHKSGSPVALDGWRTAVHGTRGGLRVETGRGFELVSDKERISLQTGEDDRFLGAFREFLGACREGRPPSPSGEDGVRAIAAVEALYEAARTGGTVAVGTGEGA